MGHHRSVGATTPVGHESSRPAGVRARVVESVLVAVSLAFCAFSAAEHEVYTAIPDWYWPVDITLGVFASVALWWARSHPVLIAAMLIVPGTLSICAGFAVLAAVYQLGALAPPRIAWALVATHVVFALPYHWIAPVPGMSWLTWLIVILLLYLLSFSFGLLGRARRQVIEGLRQTAVADRERYSAQLSTLRRDERERIAREMHDVLAHRISLLSVHAGALELRTAPSSIPVHRAVTPDEVHTAAVVIRENARLAVEDLRELLTVLREDDNALSDMGTSRPQPRLEDVRLLVNEARQAGQHVEISLNESAIGRVRESIQRTAYRIVQEGLTNARKHAPHSPVSVTIDTDGSRLSITVTNPVAIGVTQTEIPGAGAGLAGLTERVRIDGGRLTHGLRDGVFTLASDLPAGALAGSLPTGMP
jgi:signal transduction histidine kinase